MAAKASDDGDDHSMDWTSALSLPLLSLTADNTHLLSSGSGVIVPTEPLQPTIVTRPSAESLARLDSAVSSAILTPISASTSTSASAHSSALSSNLLPSAGPVPNPWRAKPSNRKRRAAEFPKVAKQPKRMDVGTRGWLHYFKAQVEHGIEYSGQAVIPVQPRAVDGSRCMTEECRRENEHPRHDLVVAP